MEEFKRFSIPVKWRKWIWVGVISLLIFAIKTLADWIKHLDKQIQDCNQEKTEILKTRTRADSIWLERLMKEKLEKADREIIQPKIDSLKNGES